MKIMSFNAREWSRDIKKSSPYYWKKRMEAMKKMIADNNPDVICFQELSFPACNYIPKGYKRVGLMINHPIYVRKDTTTKNNSWGIHYSKTNVYLDASHSVRVINVHSHWNENVIKKTMEDIHNEFSESTKHPVIACGDFNNFIEQIDEICENSFGEKYTCVREYLKMKKEDTFQNFTKESSHGEIDFFFTTHNYLSVDFKIIKNGYGVDKISDHYPIVLQITL